MAVTCALQALSILAQKGDNCEKITYDLVLADVHMPAMDDFQLVQHIHRDFNIHVQCIHNFSFTLSIYNYIEVFL